jgi:anti-sigma regulatory factor (Ser/Thr protein kinase)
VEQHSNILVADMPVLPVGPAVHPILDRRRLELVAVESAVGLSRALADMALRDWEFPRDVRSDVRLVVTELVTNVLRHTGTPSRRPSTLDVVLDLLPNSMARVLVWDASRKLPIRRSVGDDAEGGRGLLLVEALSTCWGSYPMSTGGKVVWAQMALAAEPPQASPAVPDAPSVRILGRVLDEMRQL